jgi:hypothetical protein
MTRSPDSRFPALVLVFAGALCSCGAPTSPSPTDVVFDFASGPQGWVAGFADYRAGDEAFMELDFGTDDLFMFIKRQVNGLRPSTTYRATFVVEIATDVPRGCGGVGGSPGESVFLKAGASAIEPVAVADGTGMLRMNIDTGVQANPGAAAIVLGTIEGTVPCNSGPRVWELKSLDGGTNSVSVRSTAQGDVWVFTGTDSAFEATTSLYYTRFSARFEEP